MRKMRQWALATALVCGLTSASAQSTPEGRIVKRITFDQEQVNVEYADGTADKGVTEVTVLNDNLITGIKSLDQQKQQPQQLRRWFATDGRALQSEPRQKGIYIVREQNNVKKTIKK